MAFFKSNKRQSGLLEDSNVSNVRIQQPTNKQVYGASMLNSYIGSDGALYSGGNKVLTNADIWIETDEV